MSGDVAHQLDEQRQPLSATPSHAPLGAPTAASAPTPSAPASSLTSPASATASASSMDGPRSLYAAPDSYTNTASSSSLPSPFPSVVDARQLESAVVSYLRKRGYAWTEEQLRALRGGGPSGGGGGGGSLADGSSGASDLSDAAMDVSLDVHACLTSSLFASHPRLSSPEQFEWTYSRVRSFVTSSLDVYAVELRLVLWPLFLHSFLALMLRGCPGDAVLFLSAHRKDHEALHGPELTILAHLHNEQHVRQHDYTRLALSRRIELTMSAFTGELLTAYIENEGLVTAAYILTEHAQIKVLSRRPWKAEQSSMQQQQQQQAAGSGGAADKAGQGHGLSQSAVAAINSLDVRWGALPQIAKVQAEAREQLRDTLRAKHSRDQQSQDGVVSGTQMDEDDGRQAESGSSQATADHDKGGNEERHEGGKSTAVETDREKGDDVGKADKAGRGSRRIGGKKERKERAGRKGISEDDADSREASDQIPVFKHTLQQQTVELPSMTAEQRQTLIDDLTHRKKHSTTLQHYIAARARQRGRFRALNLLHLTTCARLVAPGTRLSSGVLPSVCCYTFTNANSTSTNNAGSAMSITCYASTYSCSPLQPRAACLVQLVLFSAVH